MNENVASYIRKLEMEIKEKEERMIYKENLQLNMAKISILQELSKTCTPEVLMIIVRENSFLLNCDRIDGGSLDQWDYIPKPSAKVIKKIVLRTYPISGKHSPLDMVSMEFQDEKLYDTVLLLITCGAEVNVRNPKKRTPLHALCRRIDQNMVFKTLSLLLVRGKHAVPALLYENKFSIIDIAISSSKHVSNKLKVAKLLLEFGAVPSNNTLYQILSKDISPKEKNDVMKLVKLVMQYLLMYYFRSNLFMITASSHSEYDKIIDLSTCSNLPCFDEVIKIRYALIQEMNAMILDTVDYNTTLLTFIFERCASGLTYSEYDKPILYKVIALQHAKCYNNFDDLFRASMKYDAVLPILCKMSIFFIKLSGERVTLNSDIVKHLASYLSREEIINLVVVFWDRPVTEGIPGKSSSGKRVRQCLQNHADEEDDSSIINSVSPPIKCRKFNK